MPPTSAPALQPAMTSRSMPSSFKASKKPVWAYTPRPPPELSTAPMCAISGRPRWCLSTYVGLGDIAPHHAVRIEKRCILGDGALHHRHPAGLVLIIERQNDLLELVVKRKGVVAIGRFAAAVADGPTGDTVDAAFDPPTVQHGELRYAVECCLHTAGAAGFQRPQWRVEPY